MPPVCFQVALQPSALAADDSGHAAAVQASGGNKAKLQKGVATFKDIRINAETSGEYILRVASGSRKVVTASSVVLALLQVSKDGNTVEHR